LSILVFERELHGRLFTEMLGIEIGNRHHCKRGSVFAIRRLPDQRYAAPDESDFSKLLIDYAIVADQQSDVR